MDLYARLGVTRAASAADIDRAYRRLARRYHPGVNPGDQAAADLYRQLQEAYAVLADADRRGEYDRGARAATPVEAVRATIAFEGFDFSGAAEGPVAATFAELFADVFQDAAREATTPTRGADLELTARVSFLEAAEGAEVRLSVTRQDRCSTCAGHGCVARAPGVCPECRGAGTRRWTRGHMVFTRECDACASRGQVTSEPCRACGGAGVTARTEVLTLRLPAGIESGARVAVPGRGHAGARGGPAGDLYVRIDVDPHPHFRRVGRDVHLLLPLAIHEALLGARVDVPTPTGGRARLKVPSGTAAGQQFRVRGQGLAGPGDAAPGDLVVTITIDVPTEIDERSRELVREFGRRNTGDVRRHLFD
jgi:molecular chaperone DnaJ